MATLTVDAVFTMPWVQRKQFDTWLDDQDLKPAYIYEATFGEGYLDAKCFSANAEGKRYLVGVGDDRVPATERRLIKLTAPPPPFVFDYCI